MEGVTGRQGRLWSRAVAVAVVSFALAGGAGLAACGDDDNEGPAEEAGQAIDEGAEDAGQAAAQGAKEVEQEIDDDGKSEKGDDNGGNDDRDDRDEKGDDRDDN